MQQFLIPTKDDKIFLVDELKVNITVYVHIHSYILPMIMIINNVKDIPFYLV